MALIYKAFQGSSQGTPVCTHQSTTQQTLQNLLYTVNKNVNLGKTWGPLTLCIMSHTDNHSHHTATCVCSYNEMLHLIFSCMIEVVCKLFNGSIFIHMLCSKTMKIKQNCVKVSALFTADEV